ncbi:MAG TPA: alpha/beta fold hydrolase [Candidatus Krumholzibacteria bacterium]|nr:alpha/beta fold hydrolase [Candidatus Krumholzibacteria bacterium]
MSWHGQINRTIWEINQSLKKTPESPRQRRELLRAHFLQQFEFDKTQHVARDDRSFLFLHDGDAPLVLLLHGSTGTPAEMRDLGTYLHAHGISAYCPRIAVKGAREKPRTWEGWVSQAQVAMEISTAATPASFVCGLSLGGAVAMMLADRCPVKGLILLAPALYPRLGLKQRFLQVARLVTPTLFYHFAGWNGEVLQAMDYTRKNGRDIDMPVLAIQAADDTLLSSRGLKFLRRHARHQDTEVHLLPAGSHVITRGEARTQVFEMVTGFVGRNVGDAKLATVPEGTPAPTSDPS